jgi:hypothetical protein
VHVSKSLTYAHCVPERVENEVSVNSCSLCLYNLISLPECCVDCGADPSFVRGK